MRSHEVRVEVTCLGKPAGRVLQFFQKLDCTGTILSARGREHGFDLLERGANTLLTFAVESAVEHGDSSREILRAW